MVLVEERHLCRREVRESEAVVVVVAEAVHLVALAVLEDRAARDQGGALVLAVVGERVPAEELVPEGKIHRDDPKFAS